MMRRLIFAAVLLAFAIPLAGQSGNEGSIMGTVSDPSGAVVADALVTARHTETASTYSAHTDQSGTFRLLVLPIGAYDIKVERSGFTTEIERGVILSVGAKSNAEFSLKVAGPSETVNVNAAPSLLEISRSSATSTVDPRLVAELPVNGRNFFSLVLLTPGVTAIGNFYSFQGQPAMNSLLVDGANQNSFTQEPVGSAAANRYAFSQEAIQEFQVQSSTYSAEFGGSAGGIINVVTKSGTNAFHGAAFWYYRDHGLNATGVINKLTNQPKDPFHVNQFGGIVGGPLLRDKLFFFLNYDGQRRAQQNLVFLNLPPNFVLSADPKTAGFQRAALNYLGDRSGSFVRTFDQDVFLVKLDWLLKPGHVLSSRWDRQRYTAENNANNGPQQSLEHTGAMAEIVDSLAVSLTSTLSPTATNVARFSYVSSDSPLRSNSFNPEASVFQGGQLVLQVGHAARLPVNNAVQRGEWADTVTLGRGRHALKFGGVVTLDRGLFLSGLNFFGSYRFNSLASFGRSLAGKPLPQPNERYIQAFSATGTAPIDVHPNFLQMAGFLQDEWRLRPNLTLSLGLRYDVQFLNQATVKNPSPALAAANIDTSRVVNDGNDVAPRLGFAWAPLTSDRLVIRGGYGVFYPRLMGATAARAFFQNGVTVQTRTLAAGTPSASLIPAYPNTVCGLPNSSGAAPSCAAPTSGADIIMAFSENYQQPVTQQGSIGVEYEVWKDLAISATYLRTKGTHLQHWQDVNLLEPQPATILFGDSGAVVPYRLYPKSRPIVGFDRVLLLNSNASTSYNGLAIQANKRFSQNFQFLLAYTFGKIIDDAPTLGSVNPGSGAGGDASFLSDSLDPRLDRGPGDFDQRHKLVVGGVWDLEYGRRLSRPAKAILNGWELSGILSAAAGTAYSGLLNIDLNNDGNAATDRAPGVGRNSFHLPSTVTFDPRVSRRVDFTERVHLQVSVDAFNVFNRANISGVQTTQFTRSGCGGVACLLPQESFGTPTEALNPRIIQLSTKIVF